MVWCWADRVQVDPVMCLSGWRDTGIGSWLERPLCWFLVGSQDGFGFAIVKASKW